jgi:DNA invertase Pin-like site-specific DNA recombinase
VKYGYARVSTVHQDLQAQIDMLEAEGYDKIYSEKFTGTKTDRPEFKELFKKNVKIHILNMGIVEDTPTGRLIFNILNAFAEFERDMIVERTQEGKAIARQRADFREGRPKK